MLAAENLIDTGQICYKILRMYFKLFENCILQSRFCSLLTIPELLSKVYCEITFKNRYNFSGSHLK